MKTEKNIVFSLEDARKKVQLTTLKKPLPVVQPEPTAVLVEIPVKVSATIRVPLAEVNRSDKEQIHIPLVCLLHKAGGYVQGVEHCIYLVPSRGLSLDEEFSQSELQRISAFIAAEDAKRLANSPVIGGFLNPLARIAKIRKGTEAYKAGKRWRYTAGKGITFKNVLFPSLEQLFTQLSTYRG